MAKIIILALKKNKEYINLLTTIKVWNDSNRIQNFKEVKSFNINNYASIVIFEAFLAQDDLNKDLNKIKSKKKLELSKIEVIFNVLDIARESFLEQLSNYKIDKYNQITSPFSSNCNLEEYWNIDVDLKNEWLKINEEKRIDILKHLEVNLDYFIDRIGNILIFKEIKEIEVEIAHQSDKFITLGFAIKNEFKPNKFIANIEVKSFDDIILKETFVITERLKDIELQDADYNIYLEIYNIETNQCVYKDNLIFIKNISLKMGIADDRKEAHSQKTILHKNLSQVFNNQTEVIEFQQLRNSWTNKIRQKEDIGLGISEDTTNRARQNKQIAKAFKANNLNDAFQHLIYLISILTQKDNIKYIYLADPYFFTFTDKEFDLNWKLKYNDLFEIIPKNKELRIICCDKKFPKALCQIPEGVNKKQYLYPNIKIKSIMINNDKNSFHDRYIATSNDEVNISNSINGFKKNGVNYTISCDHYIKEAESFWELDICNSSYIIKELLLYDKD